MEYTSIAFLIGRILYGGYFLMMGIRHQTEAQMMAGYASSKGISSPMLAVRGSGLFLLMGGLGILLGVYVEVAVLALALFLIPVSFMMHAFWSIQDPMAKMGEKVQFQKNMALLGAALMLLMVPEPWTYAAF